METNHQQMKIIKEKICGSKRKIAHDEEHAEYLYRNGEVVGAILVEMEIKHWQAVILDEKENLKLLKKKLKELENEQKFNYNL
ncbi:hypothetical protein ELUMI_v1c05270 [Williamsoniiplasma luminosum]|uniref:Uncharacterized protein n=1 Tax=Williamsoniiplasma luminosum TaxID=214888 RepID=A0A2K8NWY2_9MOLU|nr:hypothetical protein [Williamsoniiplasma luminosum]ATZ17251.1 hypothetical protein ELUMI_v1c05270 [Williamsoniiplasma luminosum]